MLDSENEIKLLEFVISIINNQHGLKLKKHHKSTKVGEHHHKKELFLLCLDNISSLLEHDKEREFINFLEELQENCPNLRTVVTSSRCMGVLPANMG